MYSFIVFMIVTIQLLAVAGSYVLGQAEIFYTIAVYGSPFYSAMTLLRSDSPILENNPIYLIMLVYHIIKYGLFFFAQRNEGRTGMLTTAIIFEAIYLCTSAYFLN